MSNPAPAYVGQYTYIPLPVSKLESRAKKRYLMATQEGKPVLDYELSETAYRSFDFIKRYLECNVGDAAVGYNSFQIVQSGITTTNNFTIKGGTADNPAILVVKGYPLILFGDIEYNQQNSSGSLEDDDYTVTAIPVLTTPGAPRTDTVYVDTYLAEVSSELGSEYQDLTIKDVSLALQTANRFRIVQDILVNEGSTSIPVDGLDANSVYHRYFKLAEINRTASASITTAMIVDKRVATATLQDFKFNIGLDSDPPGPSADTIIISKSVAIENDLTVRGTITIEDITHTHSETLTVSNSTNGANSATLIKSGTGYAINVVSATGLQHHMLMSKTIATSDARWSIGFTDTETGSNVGSNLYISAMDDTGLIQAPAFKIFRDTSYVGVNTVVPIIFAGSQIGTALQYFENMYSDTVSVFTLRGQSSGEGGLDAILVDPDSVFATRKGSGTGNGISHIELGNELVSGPVYPRRWSFNLFNVEGGLDSGSDFAIQRFDDSNLAFGSNPLPIVIKRDTGRIGLNNTDPQYDIDVGGTFNAVDFTCSYIGVNVAIDTSYRLYIDSGAYISGMGVKDCVTLKDASGGSKLVTCGIDGGGSYVTHYALSNAQAGGTYRWSIGLKNIEPNDDSGSDLCLIHYNDIGTAQDSTFFVNRSTGFIGFGTETNWGSGGQFDSRMTIYGDNTLRIMGTQGGAYQQYGGTIYFGANTSTYISEIADGNLEVAAPYGVKFSANVGINADPVSDIELLVNGTIYVQSYATINDTIRDSVIGTEGLEHYRHYMMASGSDPIDTRWSTGLYAAESGSNVGSDYSIWRYNDSGLRLSPVVICIQRSTGYVGIHTTNPGKDFDVNGDFRATSVYATTGYIDTLSATAGAVNYSYLEPLSDSFADRREILKFNSTWAIGIRNTYVSGGNEGHDLCIWRNEASTWQSSPAIIINKDGGYVGLALADGVMPAYRLDVNGDIRSSATIIAASANYGNSAISYQILTVTNAQWDGLDHFVVPTTIPVSKIPIDAVFSYDTHDGSSSYTYTGRSIVDKSAGSNPNSIVIASMQFVVNGANFDIYIYSNYGLFSTRTVRITNMKIYATFIA